MFGISLKDKPALREALGQALLDKMLERTESGKSRLNKPFRKYSKAYKESDDFKASGKGSTVNLTLSGDMLGLLDITEQSDNTITLGWDDSDEAAKAHGHITGDPNGPRVKRDFFGLTNSDIATIKSEFESEFKEVQRSRGENRDEAALSLIAAIRESFGEE